MKFYVCCECVSERVSGIDCGTIVELVCGCCKNVEQLCVFVKWRLARVHQYPHPHKSTHARTSAYGQKDDRFTSVSRFIFMLTCVQSTNPKVKTERERKKLKSCDHENRFNSYGDWLTDWMNGWMNEWTSVRSLNKNKSQSTTTATAIIEPIGHQIKSTTDEKCAIAFVSISCIDST